VQLELEKLELFDLAAQEYDQGGFLQQSTQKSTQKLNLLTRPPHVSRRTSAANRKQEASPGARPHQKTPRRTERRTEIRLAKIVNEGLELGKGSGSQEEHVRSRAPAHGDERGACLKRG
jgi:hypothetical protein